MQFLLTPVYQVFLAILLLQWSPVTLTASSCELFNLAVEKGDCSSDSTYSLTFDFDYQGVNGDHFDLWVNGQFFASYTYAALPVTIPNFPKSGGSHDWIKVCDQGTPGCCRIKEFATADCNGNQNCAISGLSVVIGDCTSDSTYALTIDFHVSHPGGSQFKLYANGTVWGYYNYADLPITVMDFPQSGGSHDWIKVCDKEITGCCAIKEFKNPGCGGNSGDCKFKELQVIKECDGDSLFYVEINFIPFNLGAHGFRIKGNGVTYGEFAYSDLPVTLGPLPANCHTPYEFLIYDLDHPDCKVVYELGKVCCQNQECPLQSIAVDLGDCNSDSSYSLHLFLTHQASPTDSFQVWANGSPYGIYAYGNLPIHFPQFPSSGNNHDWIKVCDRAHPNCCLIKEFASPKCGGGGEECQFKELKVTKECDGDSLFYVTIEFVPVNPGNQGFKVQGNGVMYGSFDYNDLPVVLGPLVADCHKKYEFLIQDNANPNCKKVYDLGKVCCGQNDPCLIKELHVETGDCSSDSTYQLSLNFLVLPPTNDSFDLWINGVWWGQYAMSDLPLHVEDVPASQEPKEKLKVCTSTTPVCCAEVFFSVPNCVHRPYQYLSFEGKSSNGASMNSFGEGGQDGGQIQVSFLLQGAAGWYWPLSMSVRENETWHIRIVDLLGRVLTEQRGVGVTGPGTLRVPLGGGSRMLLIEILTGADREIHKLMITE